MSGWAGTRRGAVAALCAAAVLLLGGCGRQVAGGGTGAGTGASPTASPPVWTTMEPSAVTGARLGADGRSLSVDTRVPSGAPACVRDLKAVVTDQVNGAVWVQLTYSSPAMDRSSGCVEEKPATARVRLPSPLGARKLIVDRDTTFTLDGAERPALRLCGPLGCRPPATGCTTDSYDQALMAADAPEHSYRDDQKCDGKWLVLDFSWRTGPACGDNSAPACSSHLSDRWFFRAAKSGWVPFFEGTAGGCGDVRRKEPAFPRALCAGLAPLTSSPYPGGTAGSVSPSP